MKRTLLILIVLVGCMLQLHGQDNTRNFYLNIHQGVQAKVAIVPFEPKMLISDLHRQMCMENNMTTKEVRYALANGFCHAMRISAPSRTQPEVYGWEDEWPSSLEELYRSIGYRHLPLQELEGQAAEIHGTLVRNGEIKAERDTLTRYISATFEADSVLQELAFESDLDYTLVISELDIVNLGTPIRVNPDGAAYFVRVHYDLYDEAGEHKSGGIVKRPLLATTYDPVQFSKEAFLDVAKGVYDAISFTVLSEEQSTEE